MNIFNSSTPDHTTYGIVGYGRFGQLWAAALRPQGTVYVYDSQEKTNEKTTDNFRPLPIVAQQDCVFLTVPISEFATACQMIAPHVRPDTVIVDCCSVKTYPVTVMQGIFPSTQPIVPTHPLFGPDSVAHHNGSLFGHQIVICPMDGHAPALASLKLLYETMGLSLQITTPEEHDQQMAHSQALLHFIGRGVAPLDLTEQTVATPDFSALLKIHRMATQDTLQLFLDMQRYNPYAANMRKIFINQLIELDRTVQE